ncbi:hypothetical protein [Amycolatopsis sp. lyj-108]|uniref:hypothetical protein n=1 Tax=Amycolatopsis sp. lyj-108 TaxID=2789286 RepID=UPI0039780099
MAAPIPRHVSGELVRVALLQARPGALTTAQLVEVTDLTPSQVANGIRWIRETAAAANLTPLIWTARAGYEFSDNPIDWMNYEISVFRRVLTVLLRLLQGTLDPHQAKTPRDRYAKMAISHVNTMIESLEYMTQQQH